MGVDPYDMQASQLGIALPFTPASVTRLRMMRVAWLALRATHCLGHITAPYKVLLTA